MSGLVASALIAGTLGAGAGKAEARPHDLSMWGGYEQGNVIASQGRKRERAQRTYRAERADRGSRRRGYAAASYSAGSYRGSAGPRPKRWCGWWMRTQKGGGAHLNVAWNWRNYGRSAAPQVGAVVVWRHHVAMITGRAANGQWIVTGGNESGGVRTRARSIKGAVVRI
ncbi:MAG: hypothetical protein ACT4N2_05600 [Hyphomicrobium sp.]